MSDLSLQENSGNFWKFPLHNSDPFFPLTSELTQQIMYTDLDGMLFSGNGDIWKEQ